MSNPQEQLKQRIVEALKAITAFAMQADEILEALSQDNKAKFSAIFPEDSIFNTKATRFLPYIQELDHDLNNLPDMDDQTFEDQLTELVKKMEAIQGVLQRFHQARDYKDKPEHH